MELPHRPASAESISEKEMLEKPWKYIGYKVFSRWIASDPSLFMLRRFGALNARVALSLQDEIAQLEEKLDYMDKRYSNRDCPDIHNGSFRDDLSGDEDDRRGLIRDVLPKKLAKYSMHRYLLGLPARPSITSTDEFLNGYSKIVSRGNCNLTDIAGVRRWLRLIRPKAISESESEYIDHQDDLVPIHLTTKSLGRNLLESIAFGGAWFPWGIPWLRNWFTREAPEDIVSLRNEETVWTSGQRLEKVSSVIISVAGLAMLIGPIWILAFLKPMTYRLAVMSSFIVVFFVVVAVTRSTLHESLAATAAYSAVLVVFLQAGVGSST
jgi:hypothetical protein